MKRGILINIQVLRSCPTQLDNLSCLRDLKYNIYNLCWFYILFQGSKSSQCSKRCTLILSWFNVLDCCFWFGFCFMFFKQTYTSPGNMFHGPRVSQTPNLKNNQKEKHLSIHHQTQLKQAQTFAWHPKGHETLKNVLYLRFHVQDYDFIL